MPSLLAGFGAFVPPSDRASASCFGGRRGAFGAGENLYRNGLRYATIASLLGSFEGIASRSSFGSWRRRGAGGST